MSLSEKNLKKLGELAYLRPDAAQLGPINSILEFIEPLRRIPTHHLEPLFHPFDLYQRFRKDSVEPSNHVAQLAQIAPLFESDLYLVPKVID